MTTLTQDLLKTVLDYNPETGEFRWKVAASPKAQVGSIAGCVRSNGRRYITFNGTQYIASRLAWLWMTGEWPDGYIDHINQDRSDDRWENLRTVSPQDNCKNRGYSKENQSGFFGVSFIKAKEKWKAYIGVNGKQVFLGLFDKKEDAVNARKLAEKEYSYHKNHGQYLNA